MGMVVRMVARKYLLPMHWVWGFPRWGHGETSMRLRMGQLMAVHPKQQLIDWAGAGYFPGSHSACRLQAKTWCKLETREKEDFSHIPVLNKIGIIPTNTRPNLHQHRHRFPKHLSHLLLPWLQMTSRLPSPSSNPDTRKNNHYDNDVHHHAYREEQNGAYAGL